MGVLYTMKCLAVNMVNESGSIMCVGDVFGMMCLNEVSLLYLQYKTNKKRNLFNMKQILAIKSSRILYGNCFFFYCEEYEMIHRVIESERKSESLKVYAFP